MSEMAKSYDPSGTQKLASDCWNAERAFAADASAPGASYAIAIPPPNVTAALHLGHALNNSLQDVLVRWRRMAGDNAVWLPGTDHAGIATQTVVEKRVMAEEGKRRTEFSREEFVGKIQKWKDEYERRITDQLKAMGCSCDWDRQAFTMDPPRTKAVREAFFRLFRDGLIYRGKRLVNWDPVTQTALADDEVEMEEVDGQFYYLRYPLVPDEAADARDRAESMAYVVVATTRPETMLGDTAVAINPKDPRAELLRGRRILLPIVNREIPIVEDDYVVLPDADSADAKARYATGFLKVTPAHDPNDYEIGKRHSLAAINVMGPDAAISLDYGWPAEDAARAEAFLRESLVGQSREEARRRIVRYFKDRGLLDEVKPYKHSVGHSYRSHVAIEPWLSDQWYCRVTDDRLAGAALRAMNGEQFEGAQVRTGKAWEGGLKFFPARYARTFQTWHENIRDWCISRQLWWGHRIPVWSGTGAKAIAAAEALTGEDSAVRIDHSAAAGLGVAHVCLRADDAATIATLSAAGFVQDPDVLDTWFSSALWPMSTLNWPAESADLAKWNPGNVLCTAREIITLWVSRMVMFNLYFLDRLPFTDVFIHAMIQDGEGQKMSKSLGNGVDPLDIIESHGTDAMRFTLVMSTTHTQDLRMPVDLVDPHTGQTFTPAKTTVSGGYVVAAPVQDSPAGGGKKIVSSYGMISGLAKPTAEMPVAKNTSSKFDVGRNFCNKLWNASRFVMSNIKGIAPAPVDEGQWTIADRWILSRLMNTIKDADEALAAYRFDVYAKACYDFFWRDLCDWYIEAVKPGLKDAARGPQIANVLAAALDVSLRLMHPMIPFITEVIWWSLCEARPERGLGQRIAATNSRRLIKTAWPAYNGDIASEGSERVFSRLQELIGAIRAVRNDYKVEPKRSVSVHISGPADAVWQVNKNKAMLELLATCTIVEAAESIAAPAGSARAVAASCEIFVSGMADTAAEGERTAKRKAELGKTIAALKGRLSNEAYTAKAPAHLVQQTRDQLTEAEAELARLG